MNAVLKAPFPYFGGKSAVADLVWSRLGDPDNYVEPFAGTAAVLLRRPNAGKIETINDRNHFVANFWRAVQADPDRVAEFADSPVMEADLHARHEWLMRSESSIEFRKSFARDPECFDVKLAGWWVWGQCCWIGGGWCDEKGLRTDGQSERRRIKCDADSLGNGIHTLSGQIPDLSGDSGAFGRGINASAGQNRKLPLLTSGFASTGTGVHSAGKRPAINCGNSSFLSGVHGRPQLGDAFDIGRGVNGNKHAGTCEQRRQWLCDWMLRLKDRLRLVRICYGHWNRICDSKTTMVRLGITGAFLDPPYAKSVQRVQALIRGESIDDESKATNRANELYAGDKTQDIDALVAEVNRWCHVWGANKQVRIALCGYEGEHDNLVTDHGWSVVAWKAQGGYANRNAENTNKERERIWFSPACIDPDAGGWLF